ncbi:hypothetical protein [Candidatus Accumulibacter sp. ACC003]|uniref:hypothetical protein n=1 Tax=Candidatus Accumulibacter sp. ACC003 TaxID=2823334 RepID=UPI0025B9D24F|nr:hypothetical protein [Candidatus Accumulibacter sp. ACC003]
MKASLAIALAGALFGVTALAAPAPWFMWRSKLDGQALCAQTLPADGWAKVSGPYLDARCAKRGVPGR